jgi:hypothetical protein
VVDGGALSIGTGARRQRRGFSVVAVVALVGLVAFLRNVDRSSAERPG